MNSLNELKGALGEIEKAIGYVFKDKNQLIEAFIHRSYLNENADGDLQCNERLEFLGDTVLGLIAAHSLYQTHPHAPEGDLSWIRSRLIEAAACSRYTKELGLDRFILMGRGERMNAGRGRDSILADLLEALLGAVFLDGGLIAAERLVEERLRPLMDQTAKSPEKNYKALIQTYAQRSFREMPFYRIVDERGPDHEREFCVELIIDDKSLARGWGSSKKEAERQAALAAWKEIEKREAK